jgi:hypothetical protein
MGGMPRSARTGRDCPASLANSWAVRLLAALHAAKTTLSQGMQHPVLPTVSAHRPEYQYVCKQKRARGFRLAWPPIQSTLLS